MAQVRTRKRGKTWSYIFEAGKVDGRRKVVERGGYSTKDAAYKAGVAAFNDFMHGNIGITSLAVTLEEFMERWLREVVTVNVKPNSLQKYRSYLTNQIEPYLGAVKVQELTPALLDAWIRKLRKKGLAHNTLVGIYTLVKSALNYAVYPSELISSNPAAYIKVPKNAPRNVVKRTIITPERFAALLEKYPFGTPQHVPLMLLYHTGMRLGEVLGLCWSDVDFEAKKITLSHQVVQISGKGYFFTTLKTESSARYIIIDDVLLEELRRWHIQQHVSEAQIGDRYVCIYREADGHIQRQSKSLRHDGERVDMICTRDDGRMVLRGDIVDMLTGEGLNAHSFRHTHATQLIERGASAKGVAGRLGHSNVAITQNLYTHNTLKLQVETAEIFADTLQTKP